MKRFRLTVISIICIIIFDVGLTNCTSIKDKLSNTANNPSISSPSVDINKKFDYNQYIKKVWVAKSWNNGVYEYSSFFFSTIAEGEIKGKFATTAIVIPDEQICSPNYNGHFGNLTGTINNNIAECQFSDKDGNKGNVKLVFKENDEIEATIKYTDKLEIYKKYSLDGTFLFRSYNLKDIDGFSPFKDQCFTVDLISWGNVNFVSGKVIGGNRIPTVAYLTSKDGDILYSFNSLLPNNVNVKAVSFQDVNKDELKDIIIILNEDNDSSWHMARIIFQKADGSFHYDDKLSQEVNDSGNNKDIKTVTDYLSLVYEKYSINSNKKSSGNEGTSTPVPNDYSKVSDNLVYSNTKLGFTLTFPESWKGKYVVEENQKGIAVLYKSIANNGKKAQLFGISIWGNESDWDEWYKKGKDMGVSFRKIGVINGKVYIADAPTQAIFSRQVESEKKDAGEYDKLMSTVDSVIETFKATN